MLEEFSERLTKIKDMLQGLKVFLDYDNKKEKIKELEKKMSTPNFWDLGEESRKVIEELKELKSRTDPIGNLSKKYDDLALMMDLVKEENDPNEHIGEIITDVEQLERDIHHLEFEFTLSGEHDKANAIVSLHAGAGGTESCDWAEMLLRMFRRWVERHNFGDSITEILQGDEAGVKSCTFVVKGPYAYGYLKAEKGVHRLVRISPFDSNRRRHTSFVSVDIIPEIEAIGEIDIRDDDLRIDTYRSSGAGGQHVNKTDSAVRITHLPTGIVVACQNERSQHKNKKTALKILKARLYEKEQQKRQEQQAKEYAEKDEIAWGSQIRSYVFHPYQMVKDLRTGIETSNTQAVMDGDIDIFIEGYLKLKKK